MDFTIITASDIHISDQNPRARTDDFKAAVLDKIDQIQKACTKLKADAFIIAGDLFNFKPPSKNSHALVRELIEVFRKFKCPVYMIPGNHDMTGNSLESLASQPLGVLYSSGAVINLTNEIITKKGVKLSIVGVPYIEELDLTTVHLPPKDDCIAQICALHLYASPAPGMLFKERLYGYEEIAALGSDVFVIGHYHVDQGVQEMHGKHFINLGAIARGTIAEENITHEPKMGFIKVVEEEGKVTIQAQAIPLKVKPAEEVFDLKKKEEEKQEATEIEKFVDQLIADKDLNPSQEKTIETLIDQMSVAKTVKDKVLHFIHEASASVRR